MDRLGDGLTVRRGLAVEQVIRRIRGGSHWSVSHAGRYCAPSSAGRDKTELSYCTNLRNKAEKSSESPLYIGLSG